MRAELATPKLIVMTKEDWAKFKAATECHICNESLVKAGRDSFGMYDPNTGYYCGQGHKRCYYEAMKGFVGPRRERKPKGPDNEACVYLQDPAAGKRIQRCSERPLPHNRKISRSRAQCLQPKAPHKAQNDANTSDLPQPEGL